MTDPTRLCVDVAIGKAIEGYPTDRLLGMIPSGDRPVVARAVALELACRVLEAAGLQLAPERATHPPGDPGGAERRLARLLIELHRVMGTP